MATAVEPSSSPQPSAPGAGPGLVFASLAGAVYLLAALAVMLYGVPAMWDQFLAPVFGSNQLLQGFTRTGLMIAVFVGLVKFGLSLAGASPVKGLRGGIFLILMAVLVVAVVVRWAGLAAPGGTGMVLALIFGGGVAFLMVKLVTGQRGERWMVALEEQGWFHATAYKRVLGRLVRRLTILGILIVGGTGVYSLVYQGTLPENWDVAVPFVPTADGNPYVFRLLPDAKFTVPILLLALTIWVAYRAVNVPAFAEFLIATEAEMNKVSWTSRDDLYRATTVVLVTVLLMSVYLFAVDWLWSVVLQILGVLKFGGGGAFGSSAG